MFSAKQLNGGWMQPDIIAIGEPMLEFNSEQEGRLSEVERFTVGWGGDTSNFSIAASRAGGRVGYLTRLGDDEFGESFLKLWRKEGIDTSRIMKDPDAFTAAYFISRKGNQHYFTYFRQDSAASRMTPGFLPKDYIEGAKLLHISGISQAISQSACDTVFAAVAMAKAAGRMVSYDPNFRPKLWPVDRARAIIHETCRQADLLFPSLEDACRLTGRVRPEDIAEFYLGLGPQMVVIKLGANGALLAMADGFRIYPAYKVDPIDTSGAGDAFDGAFVAGYLAGRSVQECMRFANAAAALTTTGLGCVNPVPCLEAIEALMAHQSQEDREA
jgi:2-dehydro-3-deoxygluconokinase